MVSASLQFKWSGREAGNRCPASIWALERTGCERRTQISVRYHSVREGIRVRSHVAKGGAMETLVLVAYATRYGSTADTAQKLAEFLQRDGIQAEVRPMGQVTDLKPYTAVMLAAALYIG
jgi:hypothetical protein